MKFKAGKSHMAGRHDPLALQIGKSEAAAIGHLRQTQQEDDYHDQVADGTQEIVLGGKRKKKDKKQKKFAAGGVDGASTEIDEDTEAEYIRPDITKKILQQAREQQDEIEDDRMDDGSGGGGSEAAGSGSGGMSLDAGNFPALGGGGKAAAAEEDEDEEDEGQTYSYLNEDEITEEDERILAMFRPAPAGDAAAEAKPSLADLIMEKIAEKESVVDVEPTPQVSSLDPKVVRVYEGVGKVLASHRAGQLPKAFKIIPSLRNWEEIVYLTNPDTWSPSAMFAATRLFTSNLQERMAQRFFNLILLPCVEKNIDQFGKLNYHYYQAMLKAAFKPAAFYRGMLLPLCDSACTLRKATIIASIVAKTSIPVLHSSVAILKLCQADYSGVNSLFIRVLLDKKYALPHRVLDALIDHFCRTAEDPRGATPVLWHQALLTFVQRYKTQLTDKDKDKLKNVFRLQTHPSITNEVRRELFSRPSGGGGGGGGGGGAMDMS